MRGDDATWPLIGGLAVLVGVVVLGGVALSTAGPASATVGTGVDGDWNTTDGAAVAEGCPPADAIRTEVYNGLEDRSIEEVRSVIPDDAVRCLPADLRDLLELENGTDGDGNGTDGGECPPADTIRSEVDAELDDRSKAEIRAELSEEDIACLPADVIDQLNIGTGSTGNGTDGSDDGGTGDVECPSDEGMRSAVEMALAESTVATVREEIPDDYRDCLPADVKDRLNIDDGGTDTSTATATEPGAGGTGGPETATESEGVDCPPPEQLRKDVNKALERMPAAQFRTMVPAKYVTCFPPDLKQRLGLTASAGTASADADQPGSPDEQAPSGSSARAGAGSDDSFDTGGSEGNTGPVSSDSDGLVDSDGDGVPDRYDYAPRDPDVQSRGDVQVADDPGGGDRDGGDGIPVAAGSALLLVLAAGTGATVYRRYGGSGSDDELPQPTDPEPVVAGESRAEHHDVFGESAFDPGGGTGTQAAFTFDDHGDEDGFVFDNDQNDEDVITLDSDDSVTDEAVDAGFVFDGGPSGELEDVGEPADD